MARRVVIAKTPDQAGVILRIGETVLGKVTNLAGESGQSMTGRFTSTPAFADHADRFARLAEVRAAGEEGEAEVLAKEIEFLGIHLHHDLYDMRIDQPGSLLIVRGEIVFRPTDTFLVIRSGGLS